MRLTILCLGLVACSDSSTGQTPADAIPADADVCAREAPALPEDCSADGLTGIVLDGTWTMTGTQVTVFDGANTSRPFTETLTLVRSGTGWCELSVATGSAPASRSTKTYVDDSMVFHKSDTYSGQGLESSGYTTWFICKRPSDTELYYSYNFTGIAQDKPYGEDITGVLTR